MNAIESAAAKVGISLAAIAIVVWRTRRMDRGDLGFVAPPLGLSCLFVLLYLAWMLGTDALTGWRGPWDFTPWRQAPLAASAMRVVAVGLLGPIAEELIFRSFFFGRLLALGLPIAAVIAVTAAGWAVLHYSYA